MNYLILIAIIVVVVILFIAYYKSQNTDDKKRKKYKKLYNESGGNFDTKAKLALDTINELEKTTPIDDYRAGNIIEFNILQGNVDGHTIPNRMPLDAMLTRYTRAVGELGNQRNELTHPIRGGQRMHQIQPPEEVINMLNHFDELIMNIIADDIETDPIAIGFINVVATEAPTVRYAAITDRKREATKESATPNDVVDKFLDKSKNWTSDPQNVHDSSVNIGLRETVQKIKSTCSELCNPDLSCNEATLFAKSYLRPEVEDKYQKAVRAINIIKQGNYNSTLHEKESDIFMYVWERTKIPENEKNSRLMKEAVVDALVDCNEATGLVCMNGRCGRLIESLTLLDYDKDIGKTQTNEMIRNQVFDEVKKMIDSEINSAKISADPVLQQVGKYYAAEADTPGDDTEFKKNIELKIDIILADVANKLTASQLDNLKKECLAAL